MKAKYKDITSQASCIIYHDIAEKTPTEIYDDVPHDYTHDDGTVLQLLRQHDHDVKLSGNKSCM